MKPFWIAVPILALVVGCGPSEPAAAPTAPPPAPLSAKDQEALIPFAAGNQWVYSADESVMTANAPPRSAGGEMTWRIAKVEKVPDGEVATCEMVREGKVVDRQKWMRTAGGFFQIDGQSGSGKFSSPQPIVPFPVEKGKKSTWTGTGPTPMGGNGPIKESIEILGEEGVDTAQDRVNAIDVRTRTDFTVKGTQGHCETVSWMKPGVGIVRYHTEVAFGDSVRSLTLRLKSSVVKQP